jgi:hypothetical protein
VKRWRPPWALVVVVALALIVGACGGGDDDDDKARTSPPASGGGGAAPPASPSQLPRAFVRCMAGRGFDVDALADIHSAPPQVLQACFGALHQGGG